MWSSLLNVSKVRNSGSYPISQKLTPWLPELWHQFILFFRLKRKTSCVGLENMSFAMRTCTTTVLMQVSFLGLQPASCTPCSSQHTSPWRRIPYKLIHALQLLWSLLRAYSKAIYLLLSMYSGFLCGILYLDLYSIFLPLSPLYRELWGYNTPQYRREDSSCDFFQV